MINEPSEKTIRRMIKVDLTEPILEKSANERKEIREKILIERREAFNVLATY